MENSDTGILEGVFIIIVITLIYLLGDTTNIKCFYTITAAHKDECLVTQNMLAKDKDRPIDRAIHLTDANKSGL
ncbi:MAG: hypothetical protein V7459_00745 [Oceanicoccus sp.]